MAKFFNLQNKLNSKKQMQSYYKKELEQIPIKLASLLQAVQRLQIRERKIPDLVQEVQAEMYWLENEIPKEIQRENIRKRLAVNKEKLKALKDKLDRTK